MTLAWWLIACTGGPEPVAEPAVEPVAATFDVDGTQVVLRGAGAPVVVLDATMAPYDTGLPGIWRVLDIDGDGLDDAVISLAPSGNCCVPTYVLAVRRGDGVRVAATPMDPTLFIYEPVVEERDGHPAFVFENGDARHVWAWNGHDAALVESVDKPELAAIVEVRVDQFADDPSRTIASAVDLDHGGAPDQLSCTLWDRWSLAVCEVTVNGAVVPVELLQGTRVGVLGSSTNGRADLVTDRADKWTYNGTTWVRERP